MAITAIEYQYYPCDVIIFGVGYQIILDFDVADCGAISWCEERFGNMNWIENDVYHGACKMLSSNDRWAAAINDDRKYIFGFVNESDFMEFCLKWV